MAKDSPHGTYARYQSGCKCRECKDENAAVQRRRRGGEKFQAAQHGTRAKYNGGCKCEPCTEANRVYQKEYMSEWRDWKREEGELDSPGGGPG